MSGCPSGVRPSGPDPAGGCRRDGEQRRTASTPGAVMTRRPATASHSTARRRGGMGTAVPIATLTTVAVHSGGGFALGVLAGLVLALVATLALVAALSR